MNKNFRAESSAWSRGVFYLEIKEQVMTTESEE
jgi:hypothetical protein